MTISPARRNAPSIAIGLLIAAASIRAEETEPPAPPRPYLVTNQDYSP